MQFNTQFDEMDWIEMNPGWHMGGGHHGGMQDSLFCQILETLPGSTVELGNENAFAGYEIDFFFTRMMGGGMGNMGCGEHMEFGSDANFQFHYTDVELQSKNIDESTIQVKYWDTHTNVWTIILIHLITQSHLARVILVISLYLRETHQLLLMIQMI